MAGKASAGGAPDAVIDIDRFLVAEGYRGVEARTTARSVLETAGLTNPRKARMAASKVTAARATLAAVLLPLCGHSICLALAAERAADDGRRPVPVAAGQCALCGGSDNRRAVLALGQQLGMAGPCRVVLLGGTPVLHTELAHLTASLPLTLHCIDGTAGDPDLRQARHWLDGAHLLVIWASTPLPHKVSQAFLSARPPGLPTITVARRGIAALCSAMAAQLAPG